MLPSSNGTTTTFVYDGDGNRVRKTVGGGDEIDTLYVNKYYEKNVAGGANVTVNYYLGDRLIAQKNNDDLMYIHQDHLSGTSLMTDADGEPVGSVMKYYPFGDRLESEANLPTDRLFTGQRYDDTGLYYYNARYYDPEIGRFISPDTFVPDPANPQSFNRYSYCLNNPLKYIDPSGCIVQFYDPVNLEGLSGADLYCALLGIEARLQIAQTVWNEMKAEGMAEMTTFIEESEDIFLIPTDAIIDYYPEQARQIFPAVRSATVIQELNDDEGGYADFNATMPFIIPLLNVTGGIMYFRQGNQLTYYEYMGGSVGLPGVSYTESTSSITEGWSTAVNLGYWFGGQSGVDGTGDRFNELGVFIDISAGYSRFYVWGPYNMTPSWMKYRPPSDYQIQRISQ